MATIPPGVRPPDPSIGKSTDDPLARTKSKGTLQARKFSISDIPILGYIIRSVRNIFRSAMHTNPKNVDASNSLTEGSIQYLQEDEVAEVADGRVPSIRDRANIFSVRRSTKISPMPVHVDLEAKKAREEAAIKETEIMLEPYHKLRGMLEDPEIQFSIDPETNAIMAGYGNESRSKDVNVDELLKKTNGLEWAKNVNTETKYTELKALINLRKQREADFESFKDIMRNEQVDFKINRDNHIVATIPEKSEPVNIDHLLEKAGLQKRGKPLNIQFIKEQCGSYDGFFKFMQIYRQRENL